MVVDGSSRFRISDLIQVYRKRQLLSYLGAGESAMTYIQLTKKPSQLTRELWEVKRN